MSRLRFDDGVSFDLSGPPRAERRHDGWYVVGGGMLSPEPDEETARAHAAERRERWEKANARREDSSS